MAGTVIKMIRPFEDIEEFKAVTGFKLGDTIAIREPKKDRFSVINTGIIAGFHYNNLHAVWAINIGGVNYALDELVYYECARIDLNCLRTDKWLPFGVKTEPKDEVKYHFEENGVYSTESEKAVTILKRMTIHGIDYVVICPKSNEDKLVLEKIIYDGDSEVFICELDDDEPTSVYASKLFDKVTDEDEDNSYSCF